MAREEKTLTELEFQPTTGVDRANDLVWMVDVSDTSMSEYGTSKKVKVEAFIGDKGDGATVSVGTTDTLPAGSDATVENVGTEVDSVLDFGIPKGDRGEPGLDLIWRGVYSGSVEYSERDTVYYLGSSYICKMPTTGNPPTNSTYWDIMASKGDAGEGSGDVIGPASSTDNSLAKFDGITGKLLKDGGLLTLQATLEGGSSAEGVSITLNDGEVSSELGSSGLTLNDGEVSSELGLEQTQQLNNAIEAEGILVSDGQVVSGVELDTTLYMAEGHIGVVTEAVVPTAPQMDMSGTPATGYGQLSGALNGTNKVFTVSAESYILGSLKVFLNGQLLTPDADWEVVDEEEGTFEFVDAPVSTDELQVEYRYNL